MHLDTPDATKSEPPVAIPEKEERKVNNLHEVKKGKL